MSDGNPLRGSSMTPRERMDLVFACKHADRVPFVPAIYEHKAFLLNKTPSEVAQSEDLMVNGGLAEFDTYRPDLLTVGLDVYNVEAEALGCKVKYHGTTDVPGVESHFSSIDGLVGRNHVDPERSGRMGLFLRAAERLHQQLRAQVHVRGAVSGPFSLSCELIGCENMLIALLEDTSTAVDVLEIAAQTCGDYACAFIKRGVDAVIFDSRAAPPFVSPSTWERQLLPCYMKLTAQMRQAGARHIPLVIGGNTTSIVPVLIRTGATQFLCDWGSNFNTWRDTCAGITAPFRANLDARLIHTGTVAAITAQTQALLEQAASVPGFILGTGVCAYDINPANILTVREILETRALKGS